MRWSALSLFGFLSLFAAIPSVQAAGEDYGVGATEDAGEDALFDGAEGTLQTAGAREVVVDGDDEA